MSSKKKAPKKAARRKEARQAPRERRPPTDEPTEELEAPGAPEELDQDEPEPATSQRDRLTRGRHV